ncbi:putative Ulp1 protease family catalytic domain, papain-like cysteine peptidase superfamily [Helianthus anomalus]
MNQNVDHGCVHSVRKPEVDSFVNFNDVGDYHVATDNLQPCDSLVCYNTKHLVEDARTVALRRAERLLKPGPSVLSHFVVLKKVLKRNKNKEDNTDKYITKIRDWYSKERSPVTDTDSRLRKLGKTMASEVGPEFWSSLLGDDGSGWLSDDRQQSDRWSILPPYFQMTIVECDAIRRHGYVYVPLNIRNVHWLLGVFHLHDRTLPIYDKVVISYICHCTLNPFLSNDYLTYAYVCSLLDSGTLVKERIEVICHINFAFEIWLHINGYYADDEPLKMSLSFKVLYPNLVPQQSGKLGDCGVWVCIFIERLINKQPVYQQEDTTTAAYQMRQRLAILFYDSLLPENFDLVTTCQTFENDLDAQVV